MKKPKSKMGQIDFIMFIAIMLLVSIGVIMVYSASSYSSFFSKKYNYDSMFFLKKQLVNVSLGTIAMIFAIKVDYHRFKKYTPILIFGTLILLVLVLFSKPVNGATRWINLGFVTIQPSEIAKYVVVIALAKSIEQRGEKIKSFWGGVIPYLCFSALFAGLVLLENNLSIASVIMIVTVIILFSSGAKMSHLYFIASGLFAGVAAATIFKPYRLKRLMSFRNPWADPRGDGYQLIQSLLALGSGGLFGVGLGKSRQKAFYIPEPHNDFIFAIIGEELGFIGCALIIFIYMIFIWRGIRASLKAKDIYGTVLAMGITSVVAVQAIVNIAVVSGSMPVTGVPLPFISYGGSSLIFNMFSMGILLNVTRQIEEKSK
ncbi:stage V sporulation protein E [Hathewaya histolytica]|uniref:stage V sporulation protein E n=1 Tax=Hathewaya histolytica TaxID=1498 RepID=UPI003B67DE7C